MNDQILLEPIITMCRLIELCFTKNKTKIIIKNNLLMLDPPTKTQFLNRYVNGDGRYNIGNLCHVIVRLIKWYIIDDDYSDTDTDDIDDSSQDAEYLKIKGSNEIKLLIKFLCMGLRKLQKTYYDKNGSSTTLTLQYYINLLQNSLDGNFDEQLDVPNNFCNDTLNLLDYKKIKCLWKKNNIDEIAECYSECFNVLANCNCEYDDVPGKFKRDVDIALASNRARFETMEKQFCNLLKNNVMA